MGIKLFCIQIFGRLPYNDSDHKALLKQVHSDVVFPTNRNASTVVKSLISKILTGCKKRYTIKQIKDDQWFRLQSVEQQAEQ